MSMQKDREALINEAMDGYELMRSKLNELMELDTNLASEIEAHASTFAKAWTALEDILSAVEDIDA